MSHLTPPCRLVLAASLFVSVGCGSFTQRDAGSRDEGDASLSTALISSWRTDCVPSTTFGAKRVTRLVDFAGDRFRRQDTFFVDEACQETSLFFESFGRFEVPEEGTPALTIEGEKPLVAPAEAAEALSAQDFCGRSDWKVSPIEDLTGRQCVTYALGSYGVLSESFAVRGDDLFLGSRWRFDPGQTASDQPNPLVEDLPYHRMAVDKRD